ncbi:MAG: hypothetical protein BWX54_00341 [Verrucomicrobia bacterium ADurb.Bin018]|nr:MAG: hypothetical protein BWX54_00341 [Verrucomicrobia bacterium ADurb.Bin018]
MVAAVQQSQAVFPDTDEHNVCLINDKFVNFKMWADDIYFLNSSYLSCGRKFAFYRLGVAILDQPFLYLICIFNLDRLFIGSVPRK